MTTWGVLEGWKPSLLYKPIFHLDDWRTGRFHFIRPWQFWNFDLDFWFQNQHTSCIESLKCVFQADFGSFWKLGSYQFLGTQLVWWGTFASSLIKKDADLTVQKGHRYVEMFSAFMDNTRNYKSALDPCPLFNGMVLKSSHKHEWKLSAADTAWWCTNIGCSDSTSHWFPCFSLGFETSNFDEQLRIQPWRMQGSPRSMLQVSLQHTASVGLFKMPSTLVTMLASSWMNLGPNMRKPSC